VTGWREDEEGWKSVENQAWYKENTQRYEEQYEKECLFRRAVINNSIDDAIEYADDVVNVGLDNAISRELKQLSIWLRELREYKESK